MTMIWNFNGDIYYFQKRSDPYQRKRRNVGLIVVRDKCLVLAPWDQKSEYYQTTEILKYFGGFLGV